MIYLYSIIRCSRNPMLFNIRFQKTFIRNKNEKQIFKLVPMAFLSEMEYVGHNKEHIHFMLIAVFTADRQKIDLLLHK